MLHVKGWHPHEVQSDNQKKKNCSSEPPTKAMRKQHDQPDGKQGQLATSKEINHFCVVTVDFKVAVDCRVFLLKAQICSNTLSDSPDPYAASPSRKVNGCYGTS